MPPSKAMIKLEERLLDRLVARKKARDARASKPTPEDLIGQRAQACAKMAREAVTSEAWRRGVVEPHKVAPSIEHGHWHPTHLARVVGATGAIRALKEDIHKDTHLTTYRDLKLDELTAELSGVLDGIVRQNKEPLPKPAVPSIEMPTPDLELVDETRNVAKMIDKIMTSFDPYSTSPVLAVDIEGDNLGRDGTVDIITTYCPAVNRIYHVDVKQLGQEAFTTAAGGTGIVTLAGILESTAIKKVFWDCRMDSDALYHLHGVKLDGVIDVQLMDTATTSKAGGRKKLNALSAIATRRLQLSDTDKEAWLYAKRWGNIAMSAGGAEVERMIQESGGDWHHAKGRLPDTEGDKVGEDYTKAGETTECATTEGIKVTLPKVSWFDERPMSDLMKRYCAGDVIFLIMLYHHFLDHNLWNDAWASRVEEETEKRLEQSRRPDFNRRPEEMKKAPLGWDKVQQVESK